MNSLPEGWRFSRQHTSIKAETEESKGMETNSRQREEPSRPSYLRYGWHGWALASIVLWVALFTSHERPSDVTEQWPVAVAMLLGSYFAGSTPLGGGVVGFPILVLGFGFDASVGRDFSFAIQSVGMTSASIWILTAGQPVAWRWLRPAMLGAAVATPLGCVYLAPVVSDLGSKLTFSILVGAYGIVQLRQRRRLMTTPQERPPSQSSPWAIGAAMGILGSALSVACGSGADVVIYIGLMLFLGTEIRCALYTSVVLMAWTSILGTLSQAGLGQMSPQVQDAWLAAAPVVLFGAPLGAFVAARIPRRITLGIVTFLCLGQVVWLCVHEGMGLSAQLGVWLAVFAGFALLEAATRLQRGLQERPTK
jgi:uncharacterized membrane protein YfcA